MSLFKEVLTDVSLPKTTESPVQLNKIDSPSLSVAEELSSCGKWAEAIPHYYSLNMPIDVTQMLINLGNFNQAEEILAETEKKAEDNLTKARVAQKRGWIDDYLGRYKEELTHFQEAEKLLPDGNAEILETCRHFQGRAHVSLAALGTDPSENIAKARGLFQSELNKLNGRTDSASAFAHLWLARCDILEGNFELAQKHIDQSKPGFEAYTQKHLGSGMMGQYERMLGILALYKKDYPEAISHFQKSINIHKTTDNYAHGIAEAMIGIAASYHGEGRFEEARKWASDAVSTSTKIINYPGI